METSIYQKLLYIYYLEYAIHHNSLSISSHSLSFSLISYHFLLFSISSSPSLCDVVFTTSFPSSFPISSFLLPIPSTNKAIRAFRSRSHEPGDKSSPEPPKKRSYRLLCHILPIEHHSNASQMSHECYMNVTFRFSVHLPLHLSQSIIFQLFTPI